LRGRRSRGDLVKRPYRQILIVLPNETIGKIDRDAATQDLDRSLMIGQILEKYYIDKEIREYYEKAQIGLKQQFFEKSDSNKEETNGNW
jgi:hypothetical protein